MAHGKPSANPNDFILPDLGEGVHEAELIKWRVKAGDTVAEHDILAEMETDKALVEVPSPRAGTIATLHGTEGEILKVGSPLVTYTGAGGVARAAGKPEQVVESKRTPTPDTSRNGKSAHAEAADREDDGTVVGQMSASAAGVTAEGGKALATPAVRRLARDLGVDIDGIRGTGIGGRVTEKDVRGGTTTQPAPSRPSAARTPSALGGTPRTDTPTRAPATAPHPAPTPAPRSAPAMPPGQDTVRIPFRGVRRTIASRLRESVNQAVHFNVMDEADVSALDGLRRKLAAASGEKVSFLPFVASAVCRVLTEGPFRTMNATVDEQPTNADAEAFIIQHRAVHLGIATDTDSGLMVPVIRDADALGVLEISRHIAQIAAAARSRSIPREQLVGSTFTISNVGSHAGRFATPIINYPEVGILAVGRGRPAPVVRGGGIFVGNLLPLSLACDHRVVDGATAALALARIIELLQDPDQLLGPARA
ncbi:MAG: 2-oxo acid dehydrogenase subunit E2 [Phycisphaerales bacterium]|nr:2-oxo acid dehydrogenase subunit E2 [Phycisphaerales bacterium]